MVDLNQLKQAIIEGEAGAARELTGQALAEHVEPLEIVQQHLVPAMDEVGRLFEEEEYFIPEMLLSARAMKESMGLIRPLLAKRGSKPVATAVIGTVKGDLHDIGKNLVASMLEGGGFEVIDLGVDVTPDQFVEAVRRHEATLVCLSTLLTTTMPSIQKTLDVLKSSGVREQVRVIIGGAPISQHYADQVGADGYGENARTAVLKARELVGA